MIPFCTHLIELELDDESVNLNEATKVYVTLRQRGVVLTFSGDKLELDGNNATVRLTQEDTKRLYDNQPIQVQVNWITESPAGVSRAATDIATVDVKEQLLRRVLP